jgi:integration host factor subunit beta
MKKADLTEEISRMLEIPRKEAKILLEIILDRMVLALRKGERVELRGFGTFTTHLRAGWKTRNPRTGAQVDVLARRVPQFKPSKELRALVNK